MRLAAWALASVSLAVGCREAPGAGGGAGGDPAHGERAAGGGVVEGEAVRVSSGVLEVLPARAGARPVPLEVVPGIPIYVDDRPSAWMQIEEGSEVRAEWILEDGERVAVRIDATSPRRAPPEPGSARPVEGGSERSGTGGRP